MLAKELLSGLLTSFSLYFNVSQDMALGYHFDPFRHSDVHASVIRASLATGNA